MELSSEFARVRVSLDLDGNGPRLRVEDVRGGACIYLDCLELEALAWSTHDDLAPLLDPSYRRWRTLEHAVDDRFEH